MKKSMILLAGYPATGKSYLCNKILERFGDITVVSQDELKEGIFDQYGFRNMEEKVALEMKSWEQYYKDVAKEMEKGNIIISDYPFSEKQKGKLQALSEQYEYQMITIRLLGDIDTLYERSRKRDLAQSRHLSHLVSSYQKGDVMEDRTQADCLVTYDVFVDRCKNRGYDTFQLGYLIEMDVTDFTKIDYNAVLNELGEVLKGE
jgi:predicted kinase